MAKQKDEIQLSKEHKNKMAHKLKEYVELEFDIEIGNLQSDIFVDFITESLGKYYYNKGVADASSFMSEKTEDLYSLMKIED